MARDAPDVHRDARAASPHPADSPGGMGERLSLMGMDRPHPSYTLSWKGRRRRRRWKKGRREEEEEDDKSQAEGEEAMPV